MTGSFDLSGGSKNSANSGWGFRDNAALKKDLAFIRVQRVSNVLTVQTVTYDTSVGNNQKTNNIYSWANDGPQNDVQIIGTLTLNSGSTGSLVVEVKQGGSTLITSSAITISAGGVWDRFKFANNQWNSSGGSNDTWAAGDTAKWDSVVVTQVPEPATFALFGGLLTLGFVLYRRKRLG
jgi:hypothetical protein